MLDVGSDRHLILSVCLRGLCLSAFRFTHGPNPTPSSSFCQNLPAHNFPAHNFPAHNLPAQNFSAQIQNRFGFVEHAEGPFYYTVNGVRVTGISDGTPEGGISYYDSYGRAAAFLPPTGPATGCPETWRRYLRIGINMNRLHCSPPTTTMLDAADETGFMLVAEAPVWGNDLSRYNRAYGPATYQDLGRLCRNHPSLARYSLTVERHIEVFNGGLFGNQLTLRWSAHWDRPDGPMALAGADIPCQIEPGCHATRNISFIVPPTDPVPRQLYLVMESLKEAKPVFREEFTWLNVISGK